MDGFQVVIDDAAALGRDPQLLAPGDKVLSGGRLAGTIADQEPGPLVPCAFGANPMLRAADMQRPDAGGLVAVVLADPVARRVLAAAAEEVLECAGPVPHAWTASGGEDCTACGRTLYYLGFLELRENRVDRAPGRPADLHRAALSTFGRDALIGALPGFDYDEAEYEPAEGTSTHYWSDPRADVEDPGRRRTLRQILAEVYGS